MTPFQKRLCEKQRAECHIHFLTNGSVCLYDNLRIPLESRPSEWQALLETFRDFTAGFTSGISPKNSCAVKGHVDPVGGR
jgi:hypothetical protein